MENLINGDEMIGIHGADGGDEKCVLDFIWCNSGEDPLGRPNRKLEDSITIILKEVACEYVD
jgi:hypothetical protein